MKNIPNVVFGKGFINQIKTTASEKIPIFPVNVSNGMPAVSEKKQIQRIIKKPVARPSKTLKN